MVSATCRNCGRKMWDVPDDEYDPITSYDLGRIPEGAVGGWIWCNRQCYEEWRSEGADD